jgi:hypothetical protein
MNDPLNRMLVGIGRAVLDYFDPADDVRCKCGHRRGVHEVSGACGAVNRENGDECGCGSFAREAR